MEIRDALKRMMKTRGMTQVELAEKIEMKQTNIAMYLQKSETMRINNLLKLADACEFDVVFVDRKDRSNCLHILGDTEPEEHEMKEEHNGAEYEDVIRKVVIEELKLRGL